jgi:excisionase family DNA binding protein
VWASSRCDSLDTARGGPDARGMETRDRWMHTTEVADELGLSAETVRRLIRERRLRASAIVVGGRKTYRIRRSDLERFRQVYVRDTTLDDWE